MFFRSSTLATHTQARAFVETSMLAAGYSKERDDSTYLGFRIKNNLNTDTGFDAYFDVLFILDSSDVGLTVAQALPNTNLIPKADAPTSSLFSTDIKIELVTTPYNVVFTVINTSGDRYVFVACTIDYRELDLDFLTGDTTHFNNIRNNGQCVFRLGSSGRILYSGTPGATSFNAPLVLDNPFPNQANKLMVGESGNVLPISIVTAGAGTDKYYGILKDTYITQNSAPFHRDRGVDKNNRSHIFLRDSNGYAVMVGE